MIWWHGPLARPRHAALDARCPTRARCQSRAIATGYRTRTGDFSVGWLPRCSQQLEQDSRNTVYKNKASFERIGSCGYCIVATALLVCICWEPVKSWISGFNSPGTFSLEFPNHPESENTAFRGESPIWRAFLWELKRGVPLTGLSSTWIVSCSVFGMNPQMKRPQTKNYLDVHGSHVHWQIVCDSVNFQFSDMSAPSASFDTTLQMDLHFSAAFPICSICWSSDWKWI